jgi:CRP-like cAMP-binding protein
MLDLVFSQITPRVRYANISDFALRVYTEIYAYNYINQYKITNKMIATAFNRSRVQVSRAIAELKAADLIIITGQRERRQIETIKNDERIKYDPDLSDNIKDVFKW